MGSTPPIRTGRATLPLVGAVNLLPAVLVTVLVGFAVLLAGCGGGGTDSTSSESSSVSQPAPAQSGDAVTISEYEYSPADLTVPVGTVVKITNKDTTPHTVTSKESGAFESGSIDTGKTGQIKLEKAGTFAYFCAFHPFMKGTITVE
jgi:plastocyanin